jgi:tripartite-type tricarboxylate transporter receptor subunit TctC
MTAGMAHTQTAVEFKTISIVVGSSAGGGYDTYARILARHIGRHLRGPPSIIVVNMPGASSLKAVQYLDTGAPKDGSVIAAFNPGLLNESLLNADKIRFKFSDVSWVGSITRDLRACYVWAATGIKTFDDLRKYERFNIGAPAQGTSSYINAAVLRNMFGIAVRHVTGYAGSAEQRLAIERGELDGDCGAWSSVPADWIGNRKVNPVISFSPVPIPGLPPGVPFAGDLAPSQEAKDVLGILMAADALGRPFVVSKQVPADRLAVLRAAFDATVRDAQFLAETERLELPVVGPLAGPAAHCPRPNPRRQIAPSSANRHCRAAQPRGSTCAHLARISASSSLLERATIGKVARRDQGLQASMTTRALRGSSVL